MGAAPLTSNQIAVMTKKESKAVLGAALGQPSKMPGPAWGISASRCQTGGYLKTIPGTTCEGCYADDRGCYAFPSVQDAHERRYQQMLRALTDTEFRARYVAAFVKLINDQPEFRWFDSGDLYSPEHLELICEICRATPKTRHWLPTRERGHVKRFFTPPEKGGLGGVKPRNLNIRVSDTYVDEEPTPGRDTFVDLFGLTRSGVTTDPDDPYLCPAPLQGNVCGTCRACWDPEHPRTNYLLHG